MSSMLFCWRCSSLFSASATSGSTLVKPVMTTSHHYFRHFGVRIFYHEWPVATLLAHIHTIHESPRGRLHHLPCIQTSLQIPDVRLAKGAVETQFNRGSLHKGSPCHQDFRLISLHGARLGYGIGVQCRTLLHGTRKRCEPFP